MLIKRDIDNALIFLNVHNTFIEFNNCDTQRLNGPGHLFHLLCCNTWHVFGPLRVYEPGFNMDKYGNYLNHAITKSSGYFEGS